MPLLLPHHTPSFLSPVCSLVERGEHGGGHHVAIKGRNLSFSALTRQGRLLPILKDCSIRVPRGQLWMLLGPNACGKSIFSKF